MSDKFQFKPYIQKLVDELFGADGDIELGKSIVNMVLSDRAAKQGSYFWCPDCGWQGDGLSEQYAKGFRCPDCNGDDIQEIK